MNSNLGIHGVTQVRVERFNLPSGTVGIEVKVTVDDGSEMSINLFTGATSLEVAVQEIEEVAA